MNVRDKQQPVAAAGTTTTASGTTAATAAGFQFGSDKRKADHGHND